jgi:hypothetical protein
MDGQCIQGRRIGSAEIRLIRGLLGKHSDWNRTRLSRELCEIWDWRDHKGRLKDMASRTLLLKLERRGLITLPPRQSVSPNANRNRSPAPIEHDRREIRCVLRELLPLSIGTVDGNTDEPKLFRSLIAQYHYLGLRNTVGQNMKYLIRATDGRLLGAALFGSPAWKTKPRDAFIGWSARQRESGLWAITNNTRFLILPWVRVDNLASHVLSRICRRIDSDWQEKYGHSIHLLESFVERDRFRGTCYQAANWVRVGRTQGRTRNDRNHTIRLPVKDVYLYPLKRNFRRQLVS